MNINVSFHISVRIWNTRRVYQMLVEHYYSSEQVERFRIRGKNREVLLEKRLAVHRQPWKIVKGNIDTTNMEQTAMAIRDTQNAIEDYLFARKTNPVTEGYFSADMIKREMEKKNKKW